MDQQAASTTVTIASGDPTRFSFGRNWLRYSRTIDENRTRSAEDSLRGMLNVGSLSGMSFLDIGSGSGLFSLAAYRLGAEVRSFDFDPDSVACTTLLKWTHAASAVNWVIEPGSVLDRNFLDGLGCFDIVYAMAQVVGNVAPGGLLYLSIYNDQGWKSRAWTMIKRTYNRVAIARPLLVLAYLVYPGIPSLLYGSIRRRSRPRGMNFWSDLLDWLGGYPFEVASRQQVVEFYQRQGFALLQLKSVGNNQGCNEFLFRCARESQRQ
jgi:SAM-dependent methyltransferase